MDINLIKKIIFIILIALPVCLAYDGTMDLQCKSYANFKIGEKQYCLGSIPSEFGNEEFRCISYVSYNLEILQTNPQYKERSQAIISITGTEQETRQYFEPANLVVPFYYTQKNLHPKINYSINLLCNSDNSSLHGETFVYIDYENLEFVFTRTEWMMRNAPYIIGGILLLLIIIGVLFMWVKVVK